MSDSFYRDLSRFTNAAKREVLRRREMQTILWLRENWPWWARWAIGYTRAIRVLDRLGLVPLPVFVDDELKSEKPEDLMHE